MTIQIEIQSDRIDERGGTIKNGERAGQQYHIRQQEAWVHNGKAYPERFVISLQDGQGAYPPGMYQLHPGSLEVGEYGRLQFARRIELLREAEPVKSAKAG